MNKPLKPAQFDVTKVKHSKAKAYEQSKNIRVTYDKQELRFRTKLAVSPFGVSFPKEDDGAPPSKSRKYSVDINVNDVLAEERKLLEDLDKKNCEVLFSQSDELFGKGKYDSVKEIEKHVYEKIIKKDKKGEYEDRFKMKLPFRDGAPAFKVYDENNAEFKFPIKSDVEGSPNPELIWFPWSTRRMEVEAIVECEGLWIINSKVYCTFRVLQLRYKRPAELANNAFLDSDDEEDTPAPVSKQVEVEEDDEEEDSSSESEADEEVKEVQEKVEELKVESDSDSSDSEESEPEPEPVTKKKTTKKRGT